MDDATGVSRAFWATRVMLRQEAAYASECGCTDELMKRIGARHRRLKKVCTPASLAGLTLMHSCLIGSLPRLILKK